METQGAAEEEVLRATVSRRHSTDGRSSGAAERGERRFAIPTKKKERGGIKNWEQSCEPGTEKKSGGLRFLYRFLAEAIFTVCVRERAKLPRSFRGVCTRSEVAGASEMREARCKAPILGWPKKRDGGLFVGRRVFFSSVLRLENAREGSRASENEKKGRGK